MQHNPQELSWQAIQTIVGVKLPSIVLRFDYIGLNNAASSDESDSDVEIIENAWDSDNNPSSRPDHSDNDKSSREQSASPVLHLVEPDNNNLHETPLGYINYNEKMDTKDDKEPTLDNDDVSNGNVSSIENYLEVTLSTDAETNHVCSKCNQLFPNEQLLSSHTCSPVLPEEGLRYPCSCRICGEKFPSYWELGKHNISHFPGLLKPNSWDSDNNSSSRPDHSDNVSTDAETNHVCSKCNKLFPNEQLLSSHTCSTVVPEEGLRYPCSCRICGEKFPSYWELGKHNISHFPGMLKPNSTYCQICQKDYTKTGIINHIRKHTGERPFVCEICQKAFSQSSSLSIHMKFHMNDRRHCCTVCEKKFVTKSELSRHMTVHTKQKSYYCGVCDKAFTRSDNMKKHEKTHANNV